MTDPTREDIPMTPITENTRPVYASPEVKVFTAAEAAHLMYRGHALLRVYLDSKGAVYCFSFDTRKGLLEFAPHLERAWAERERVQQGQRTERPRAR
jgi:hypothetical protein